MTPQQNELLTRVGAGTPMGSLLRNYWIPALTSSALVADGPPVRIRLLGEDLLAFRDSSGRVGVVSPACPHRSAPLYYGRNEEGGLRCVYHGWKFDVTGACVDLPTEEAAAKIMANVRLHAYEAIEKGQAIWVWMGAQGQAPGLPDFEWMGVPQENIHFSLRVQECNWVQALEGSIDSAHAAILHGRVDKQGTSVLSRSTMLSRVKQPRHELVDSPAGVSIATLRQLDDLSYWRITQFLMPFYTLVAPFEDTLSGQAWVPMDDEHTLVFMYSYDPNKPLDPKSRDIYANGYKGRDSGHGTPNGLERRVGQPYDRYWPRFSRHNDFGIDWEEQRTRRFSGIPALWAQDSAVQSGLDPIVDRSRQHLGTTDAGIVRVHRRLIDAATQLGEHGKPPAASRDPSSYALRSFSLSLKPGESWKDYVTLAGKPGGPVMSAGPPEA
ncbi:MAG TPA: Rieske 2Fe-2S domain-containing protein [Ramlibacter sp.]|uniref:Rieske 2Fe-2S domain-containing protein n=1 Tax=Ramlibacter sp. TaxID=1917967 RepID=UPI002C09B0A2|nr:Rieske 2Fe-2S domain-containing protein [Ramlibacter sp.]HVZ46482.1 Rieske 2Fe-2S domain-containing protein [Ramlibacter sp.]